MPGGNARLSEHSWGADAHATEAALSMVRGVDQVGRVQSSEYIPISVGVSAFW